MHLHFSREEFAVRRSRMLQAMAAAQLDGMLLFKQESRYWLTGYDTGGHSYFQCLYLGTDGRTVLLSRLPDMRQARYTSIIEDVRVWVDGPNARPAEQMAEILAERGCRGKRLGVEKDCYGCSARVWLATRAACDGLCTLVDASYLVDGLRAVKSEAELAYLRKAAELADTALEMGARLAEPDAFEGTILAAMQATVHRGGGQQPATDWLIGSGSEALLMRYHAGRRHLGPVDQLQIGLAGVYMRYHARLARTIVIGRAGDRQKAMHAACVEALSAAESACRPGTALGEVFNAAAQALDRSGFRDQRLDLFGHGTGGKLPPSWMDWPIIHAGSNIEVVPNMTLFLETTLLDAGTGFAMALGETVAVGGAGCSTLSRLSRDLIIKA